MLSWVSTTGSQEAWFCLLTWRPYALPCHVGCCMRLASGTSVQAFGLVKSAGPKLCTFSLVFYVHFSHTFHAACLAECDLFFSRRASAYLLFLTLACASALTILRSRKSKKIILMRKKLNFKKTTSQNLQLFLVDHQIFFVLMHLTQFYFLDLKDYSAC